MKRLAALLLLALSLFAAACASDAATEITALAPADEADKAEPTVDTDDTDPEAMTDDGDTGIRIVSLSPTATEMLFAIGAGDMVIAADEFSDYPPEAPTVPGLSGWDPNIEAIAALNPTLVVSESAIEGLDVLGIENLVQWSAATFDDVYAQMDELGVATGHEAEAAEAGVVLQAEVEALRGSIVQPDEPLTYYHELDDTLYSVTSQTFIGEVYSLLGLVNIADAHDPDGFFYPQLNEEVLLTEDPDLIFLADTKCCAQSAETIAKRPGWDRLSAVQAGNVFELDDDIASRWGPRIVEMIAVVAEAINTSQSVTVN